MAKVVVLLSGGLDSCTVAAMAQAAGHELYTLSIDYGQRHAKELDCARRIAAALGAAQHLVLDAPVGALGGSALTDKGSAVPDAGEAIGQSIPVTYVPARNTVFLALALGFAEVVGADEIRIGANAVDYSGYPDCRPEYLEAFERMANLATKRALEGHPIRIVAPLLSMGKDQIIATALGLGAPLQETWSCYRGGDEACGRCESCVLRLRGFEKAGAADPIRYEVA